MPKADSPSNRLRSAALWLLWAWLAVVIWGAFYYAPLSQGFAGLEGQSPQSSRIVFFHVPFAVASFFAFLAAGVWSLLYLAKRRASADQAAHAAVEVGFLYCVLATVTGAVWARVQWGAYWNGDPRQTSIGLAILFYGAYLILRGSIEDPETRARLAAAYAVLGLVVAPFLYFILPRMASFSLHPEPGGSRMEPRIAQIVVAGIAGYTALFFWLHNLRRRSLALENPSESV
jgi:heme exporter protein C